MKKILSLGLAAAMAVSAMPMAFAADTQDHTQGTMVEYVATTQSAYTITVPAKMTPKLGQEVTGTVTLSGSWASNETVKVTADEKVVLTNSINPLDTHELAVTLPVMEHAGDNTEAKTYTETVTLAEMPAAALFGEWTGKFNYNVEFDDGIAETVVFYDANYDFVSADSGSYKAGQYIKLDTATGKAKLCSADFPSGMSIGEYTAKAQTITVGDRVVFEVSEDGYTITMKETLGSGDVITAIWKYTP